MDDLLYAAHAAPSPKSASAQEVALHDIRPSAKAGSNGRGAVLRRTTFRTSRLMDFCSEKELTAQVGHPREYWPLVVLKELVDNALDACEDAGIPPEIQVKVEPNAITVIDNGPGIPQSTIDDVLDFQVRVSSREAYVAPDRGRQGNALKTIIAMPFVLDGQSGRVDIAAHGVLHEITVSVDHIKGEPVINCVRHPSNVQIGTFVMVHWSDSPCSLEDVKSRFVQIAGQYATLNPHLTLTVEWCWERSTWAAVAPDWTKWKPSDPTSTYWYTDAHLSRLLSAYIVDDEEAARPSRALREVVAEFRGLSRSAKQRKVLNDAGLARSRLSDLVQNRKIDPPKVAALLESMKRHSKPVKPSVLGIIGEDQLRRSLEMLGCATTTLAYKRLANDTDGVPWIVEAAFGAFDTAITGYPQASERQLVCGINWSPSIIDPFRTLGSTGESLADVLTEQRAGPHEPIAIVLHLACARVEYTDRGKSAVALPMHGAADAIREVAIQVTKKWTKMRRAEERNAARIARRSDAFSKLRGVEIKEAAWEILPEAYHKASGRTGIAHARQMFYAARPHILERTGLEQLDSGYFTQTLLPDYMLAHRDDTADWDVVYDSRGSLIEPHTGKQVPLGTLHVRDYLNDIASHSPNAPATEISHQFPTIGPLNRFGAILFTEKEGFNPLFERVRLKERYDVAPMSTKGMSVTAARSAIDELCRKIYGIPLLVLHDFDKSGFSILATLQSSTRRYEFTNDIRAIDLGLRLDDIKKLKLDSEPVSYKKTKDGRAIDPRPNLRKNGATEAEIKFLCSGLDPRSGCYIGRRVELNQMTSDQFVVEYIPRKFKENGIKKLLPDEETIASAYRRAATVNYINEQIRKSSEDARKFAAAAEIPPGLRDAIQARLHSHPEEPWDTALAAITTKKAY